MNDPTARRLLLEGVPYVGFDRHPDGTWECCPFPSALKACLTFLGDPPGYACLMGATGAAFRLLWNSHAWDGGNVDLMAMYPDPVEAFRRGFAAAGYACEILGPQDGVAGAATQALFKDRVVTSIARGRPVMGLGVIGPPEVCIIAGYDDAGEVVMGWNFFQATPDFCHGVEFEPGGYFRKRNWPADTQGLLLIGERLARDALRDQHRQALHGAIEVVDTPAVGQRHNGLAAYQAWAADLLRDEQFATDDTGLLAQRLMAHDDAGMMVAEGRYVAAQFLDSIAAAEPAMAPDLLAAAELYRNEHELVDQMWGLLGEPSQGEERARRLARPEVRCQSAALILQAREKDALAIEHIKQALSQA